MFAEAVVVCERAGGTQPWGLQRHDLLLHTAVPPVMCHTADVICLSHVPTCICLQAGNLLTPEMLLAMAPDPLVFACANPVPEIDPDVAAATRPDVIMATGRSDFPNQINNVCAFPYIFRSVAGRHCVDCLEIHVTRAVATGSHHSSKLLR